MKDHARQIFGDNILMKALGPLKDRPAILQKMLCRPTAPQADLRRTPVHVRRHMLMDLRNLYIPPLEAAQLHESVDLAVRQVYKSRNPNLPSTWAQLSGTAPATSSLLMPANAIVVTGPSGVGKTQTGIRALCLYPNQVYLHENFPKLIGSHAQVVWQSVSVPASGRLVHLANALMHSWDQTLVDLLGTTHRRFAGPYRRRGGNNGLVAMEEWRQVASSHFLGVLHLDEVQNFFKLPSVMKRRTRKIAGSTDAPIELSIAEDMCLKYVLELASSSQFVVLLSGTVDGVSALMRRLSNAQRFAASGFHQLALFTGPESEAYLAFLKVLGQYQYVRRPVSVDNKLARLIFLLSAGVKRIIVALWITAHRVAFERSTDDLRLTDFQAAADTYLAPLKPAVQSLLSQDPQRMQLYEDLVPRDPLYWATIERVSGSEVLHPNVA